MTSSIITTRREELSHIMRQVTLATFVSVAIVTPLLWLLLDRDPPFTYEKVEIEPNTIPQSGDAYVTFYIKRGRRACDAGLVYRELLDSAGKLHVFDPVVRARPPELGEGQFTRIFKVPNAMEPGRAFYRGISCYPCNPLQSWLRWPVCLPTPEVSFNVTKEP